MLIRAYGMYWNPEVVDWGSRGAGNKGALDGKIKHKKRTYRIDFWDGLGIYVLYEQFRPIYIGKAVSTRIGPRVRNHLTDRFAGRWDMFSWFSQSTINTTTRTLRAPGTRSCSARNATDTLEALAILVTDPPLNRKRETIPNAALATQIEQPHPKTIRKYLEEILEEVK